VEILKLLDRYPIVKSYDVLDYKSWQLGYYISLKIIFRNHTVLFAKEYVSEKERNYSYHWQSGSGKLITRWDNAPHHKHIKTFPHHKHIKNSVTESTEMGLKEVLDIIQHEI